MEFGYRLLAEAFLREGRLDEAFEAISKLPAGKDKTLLTREVRNGSVKNGRLDLYQKASRMIGLDDKNPQDLAIMLSVNINNQALDTMIEIIDLLPDNEIKQKLITTAIIESAFRGRIVVCEKLAEKRGTMLTKEEAIIAKEAAIREGWISDAKRAAEVAEVELSKEEYTLMFVANKDKGLLREAQETARLAGEELDVDSLVAILLAGVKNNRGTVWEIAEML